MAITTWTFLRPRPGVLEPLSRRALDAFFFHGARLEPDADGLVRYAEVIVRLEERRAIDVVRVVFPQHRTLPDSTIDRDHVMEAAAAGMGSIPLGRSGHAGVIDAAERFARRRMEHLGHWKPSDAEMAVLRELVNRRAGSRLM